VKDYYKILNIDRYATDRQIKKAYRKLALKYHPDKSKSAGSHVIFTEINEAYQVLSRKENKENYNYIYDYEVLNKRRVDSEKKYSTPMDWGRNIHKKTPYSEPVYARDDKSIDLSPYIRSVRIVSILSFLFTFLVILDYFLPEIKYDQTIVGKSTTYKSTNTIIIETEDFQFPLNFRYSKMVRGGDIAIVSMSPIFGIQQKLNVTSGMDNYEFNPHYSIYNIFAFFLIILLITSYLGIYHKASNAELIFSAGVANVFLSILVMYLIFLG
jgi:hypothetical protein